MNSLDDCGGHKPAFIMATVRPSTFALMPMGPDYRKVRYSPKAGKRSLAACASMVLTGFAVLASPFANVLDQGFQVFGHRVTLGFIPLGLIFFGIVNVIPAVMMLTPPSKR